MLFLAPLKQLPEYWTPLWPAWPGSDRAGEKVIDQSLISDRSFVLVCLPQAKTQVFTVRTVFPLIIEILSHTINNGDFRSMFWSKVIIFWKVLKVLQILSIFFSIFNLFLFMVNSKIQIAKAEKKKDIEIYVNNIFDVFINHIPLY